MRKLNLEQITKVLNSEFKKEGRRIVFWYDEKQEFLSEIEELKLENVKLLRLNKMSYLRQNYFLKEMIRRVII